jgi:DNA-binding HxlR family transcriptional regulator
MGARGGTRRVFAVTRLPGDNRDKTEKAKAMTQRRLNEGVVEQCPIRDILDRIGDRWTLLTLWALSDGTLRFTAIKREIPDISQRMLAQTLRRLEQDGFVSRLVHPTVPPRVDYTLTALGRSFLGQLNGLVQWADDNHDAVRAARRAYVPPTTETVPWPERNVA